MTIYAKALVNKGATFEFLVMYVDGIAFLLTKIRTNQAAYQEMEAGF